MNAAEVRALLGRHGLRLRRDLGQNFLIDAALAERLVAAAGVGPADTVFEIGAGLGTLTRALAARAARVVALEIDAGIVRALHSEELLPEGVEIVHADVLAMDLAAAVARARPPVRIVANLPYSISGPALRRLLDLRERVADWSVMIQREVAQRLLAPPGSRDYGSLTVLHRLTTRVRKVRDIAPHSFTPAPKVHSTFLRITPLAEPVLAAEELAVVERVVRAAFAQRRKTLANALRGADPPLAAAAAVARALERAGAAPRVRAEALAPEVFLRIARELAP